MRLDAYPPALAHPLSTLTRLVPLYTSTVASCMLGYAEAGRGDYLSTASGPLPTAVFARNTAFGALAVTGPVALLCLLARVKRSSGPMELREAFEAGTAFGVMSAPATAAVAGAVGAVLGGMKERASRAAWVGCAGGLTFTPSVLFAVCILYGCYAKAGKTSRGRVADVELSLEATAVSRTVSTPSVTSVTIPAPAYGSWCRTAPQPSPQPVEVHVLPSFKNTTDFATPPAVVAGANDDDATRPPT